MSRPPLFLKLRFGKINSRHNIWLPLFILFPFLIIILLLLVPFLLLAALVLWGVGRGKPFLMFIPAILAVFWALKGLEIQVNDKTQNVFISIK
ncbi:MAG: hypothetical protein PHQ86_04140 [Dehalococcoidales bacterium]|nr:hypothetical protein [Dehalococcoidales bacterium]